MKPRTFDATEVLARLNRGETARELTEAIREVVVGVINGGEKSVGKVNFTLTINKLANNQITLRHTLKAVPPAKPSQLTALYVTDDYSLTPDNPDQERLPIHDHE